MPGRNYWRYGREIPQCTCVTPGRKVTATRSGATCYQPGSYPLRGEPRCVHHTSRATLVARISELERRLRSAHEKQG